MIQPPLTPMIDVVFLLLLFFLLACRFRAEEGQIPANLPNVSGPEAALTLKLEPIYVTLRPTGQDNLGVLIGVKRADVSLTSAAALYEYLNDRKVRYGKGAEKVPVFIAPRGAVRWAHVVNAFNQALRAEYRNIGFAPSVN